MEKTAYPVLEVEKAKTKERSTWVNDKAFAIGIILITVLFAFFPSFNKSFGLPFIWIKGIQLVGFIALGMANAVFVERHFRGLQQFPLKLAYSLKLSFFICFVFLFIYFLSGIGSLLLAPATACAFLVPFLIAQSWEAYQFVSPGGYKLWYSRKAPTKDKVSVFLTGIPVYVKLPVKEDDKQKKLFTSMAPTEMKLGEFFDHFLLLRNNNERQNIALADEQQRPYGWVFYETRMKGFKKRRLDPDVNIADNDIRKNSVIIAERVTNEYERGAF